MTPPFRAMMVATMLMSLPMCASTRLSKLHAGDRFYYGNGHDSPLSITEAFASVRRYWHFKRGIVAVQGTWRLDGTFFGRKGPHQMTLTWAAAGEYPNWFKLRISDCVGFPNIGNGTYHCQVDRDAVRIMVADRWVKMTLDSRSQITLSIPRTPEMIWEDYTLKRTPSEIKRANKTDAGNGSKAICRASNVHPSPSPDPRR